MRQPRILITRRTTYERLREQVAEHSGGIVMIIGMGERARRLLERLHRDLPNVDRPWTPDGHEHVVTLHDGSLTAIAWHRDEPGKPPRFELNDMRYPQGVFGHPLAAPVDPDPFRVEPVNGARGDLDPLDESA